ncbi:MAG: hypothetical protein ACI4DU_03665 [Lachnospiraceae bacterium]
MIEIFRFIESASPTSFQKKEGKNYIFFLVGLILVMVIVPAVIFLFRKETAEVYLEMLCADIIIFLMAFVAGITIFAIRMQKKQELVKPRTMAYVIYNDHLYEVYVFIYVSHYRHGHGGNPFDFMEKNEQLRKQFADPVFLTDLLEKYMAGQEIPERFCVRQLSPMKNIRISEQKDYLVMETAAGKRKIFDNLERFSYFAQRIKEIGQLMK